MDRVFQDLQCQICHDVSEKRKYFIIQPHHPVVCKPCGMEVTLRNDVRCPLDRLEIHDDRESDISYLESDFALLQTLLHYQESLLSKDYPSTIKSIENHLTIKFMANHRCCLLDGHELNEVKKCFLIKYNRIQSEGAEESETVSRYIFIKYQTLGLRMFKGVYQFNKTKVRELVDNKYYFVMLMKHMAGLQAELQNLDPDKDKIQYQIERIKTEFRNIAKGGFRPPGLMKLSKYTSLIDEILILEGQIFGLLKRRNKLNIGDFLARLLNVSDYYDCFLLFFEEIKERIYKISKYEEILNMRVDIIRLLSYYERIARPFSRNDPTTKLISSAFFDQEEKLFESFLYGSNLEFFDKVKYIIN